MAGSGLLNVEQWGSLPVGKGGELSVPPTDGSDLATINLPEPGEWAPGDSRLCHAAARATQEAARSRPRIFVEAAKMGA